EGGDWPYIPENLDSSAPRCGSTLRISVPECIIFPVNEAIPSPFRSTIRLSSSPSHSPAIFVKFPVWDRSINPWSPLHPAPHFMENMVFQIEALALVGVDIHFFAIVGIMGACRDEGTNPAPCL